MEARFPDVFVIFGLLAFSFVLAGVMTLVVLGVAEEEIADTLGVRFPREELRMLTILIFYSCFAGFLEGTVLDPRGYLLAVESIPFIVAAGAGMRR